MVAAPIQLHHLLTVGARLPALEACNFHQLLDAFVLGHRPP
jgi:hypothetical protein